MSKLEQGILDKLIVALDFSSKEETFKFLKHCNDQSFSPAMVKIGMELFYSEGPEMVREIQDMGFKIFLDLKIHDIPNTTASALTAIAKLNVDITNIHAFAGKAVMKAAAEAIKEVSPKTKLIAVTILTSMSQDMLRDDLLINTTVEEYVLNLALNSKEAGLDGVVSSAHEASLIKKQCGKDFLTVCPGIRFADSNSDDQQRIMTPERAIASGADYIVMGRAITQAKDLSALAVSIMA
jgi:orotidine-5'-phosphate decarboxylase